MIDPCIPDIWAGFKVERIWRGAKYSIEITNPDHVQKGVKKIIFDGEEVAKIPACEAGTDHSVKVVMG